MRTNKDQKGTRGGGGGWERETSEISTENIFKLFSYENRNVFSMNVMVALSIALFVSTLNFSSP